MKEPVKNLKRGVSSRRTFLQTGVIGGAAAAIYPALAAARAIAAKDPSNASAPEIPPFELEEVTIDQLHADMKSGKYTARSLTEKYLQRRESQLF